MVSNLSKAVKAAGDATKAAGKTASTAVAVAAPITIHTISEYGKPAMQGIADVASRFTSIARGSDLDDIGKLLNNLIVTAKEYDPNSIRKKNGGVLGFFRRKTNEIRTHYQTVDGAIGDLTNQISQRVTQQRTRIQDLQALYEANESNYNQLGEAITEMNYRIAEMEANIPEENPTDAFASQRRGEWIQAIELGKKRVDDLMRVQQLSAQQAPQIKLMQQTSASIAQKFDDIQAVTIPAWKSMFSLYIVQQEQKQNIELTEKIDESTNTALRASADLTLENTRRSHQSLGRSVIDTATLEHTQKQLIASVESARKIAMETQARIAVEQPRIQALQHQLNKQLNLTAIGTVSTSAMPRLK